MPTGPSASLSGQVGKGQPPRGQMEGTESSFSCQPTSGRGWGRGRPCVGSLLSQSWNEFPVHSGLPSLPVTTVTLISNWPTPSSPPKSGANHHHPFQTDTSTQLHTHPSPLTLQEHGHHHTQEQDPRRPSHLTGSRAGVWLAPFCLARRSSRGTPTTPDQLQHPELRTYLLPSSHNWLSARGLSFSLAVGQATSSSSRRGRQRTNRGLGSSSWMLAPPLQDIGPSSSGCGPASRTWAPPPRALHLALLSPASSLRRGRGSAGAQCRSEPGGREERC